MEINKKLVSSLNNLIRKDKEINSHDCKYDLARRLKNKIIARKPSGDSMLDCHYVMTIQKKDLGTGA